LYTKPYRNQNLARYTILSHGQEPEEITYRSSLSILCAESINVRTPQSHRVWIIALQAKGNLGNSVPPRKAKYQFSRSHLKAFTCVDAGTLPTCTAWPCGYPTGRPHSKSCVLQRQLNVSGRNHLFLCPSLPFQLPRVKIPAEVGSQPRTR
jgi:hypothetical protein